jgi:PAS domain S-box-containing protein
MFSVNPNTLLGLINNAALLLALAVLYDTLPLQRNERRWTQDIVSGVLIGLIGVAVMLTPWRFSEGVVFDTRSILLSITGLFFGLIPTLIATGMTCALRIYQGGDGVIMGVSVILTSASLGLIWRYMLRSKVKTPRWYEFYVFGIVVHVAMLLWAFVLPRSITFDVLNKISVPVMVIYPVGTVLLGLLLTRQRQRSQWEQELRQERDLLARISETSPVGIVNINQTGEIEYANARAEQILGLSRDVILQRTYNAPEWKVTGLDGEPFPDEKLPFRQVISTGKPVRNISHAIVWPDGNRVLLSVNAAPVLNASGQIDSIVATIEDVTERKRAERALQESEEKFRTLYESMDELFVFHEIVYDSAKKAVDYRILDCNPAFGRITGIPRQQAIGALASQIYGAGSAPYLDIYSAVAETGKPTTFETEFSPMGKFFRIAAFSPAQGFFATVAEDITSRIKADEELRKINAELDLRVAARTAQLSAANAELEAFAYSVSHDLRAPLRAINGFAQILTRRHREALDEEGQKYLGYVVQASEQMGRLIDDLLQYSHLGRRAVSYEMVDCQQVLAQTLEQLAEQIAKSQADIRVPRQLPVIQTDDTLIRQIMFNLLDNALKYQPPGQQALISVTWEAAPDHVTIHVQDNGIGIPPEHHEKIFNVFQRLHNEDEYPGTGVGLALVKKAVELLNGQTGVQSMSGEGSTFWVRLPIQRAMEDE